MILNMMTKSLITRKDIVTHEIIDRNKLIRISIQKNGVTRIDKEYTFGGRGIYFKPSSVKEGIENKIIYRNIKRFKGSFNEIKDELLKEVIYG